VNPCEVFGVPATATPAEVRDYYLELSQVMHPDKGGDAAKFAAMGALYKKAFAFAKLPRVCLCCDGKGKTPRVQGFSTTWDTCSACGGRGKVTLPDKG